MRRSARVTWPPTSSEHVGFASRVSARCPYFGRCGGCTLQELRYEDQLALKRARVQDALAACGWREPVSIRGLEDPWRYRNKVELTFGQSDGRFVLGLHAARAFSRVVDLEDCLLLPERVMPVARTIRQLAEDSGYPAYHPIRHQGMFRQLIIRVSGLTGKLLVCFVTACDEPAVMEAIADAVLQRHPEVTSVYWGVTDQVADRAIPAQFTRIGGDEWFEDQVGPFRLVLHPLSFLQTSRVQAERLYETLCEVVRISGVRVAWDLYCGLGLIGLYLAREVEQVYGIDSEPHHLELARRNAALNQIQNLDVRQGRVEDLLGDRRFWLHEAKPDLVVVDPPRAGLHRRALSGVLAARPLQVAYLSCNLQTLVRDLAVLTSSFPRYRLHTVVAFDMFPQTDHVETLVLLTR